MDELLPKLDGMEKSGDAVVEHIDEARKLLRGLADTDARMFANLEARVQALEDRDAEHSTT